MGFLCVSLHRFLDFLDSVESHGVLWKNFAVLREESHIRNFKGWDPHCAQTEKGADFTLPP